MPLHPRPERYEGKLTGFIYLATNPAMPGIVKVGRTQTWPHQRVAKLNSGGVPEPFSCVTARFFVDCYTAEEVILAELGTAGSPCTNKGFFKITEKNVEEILERNYWEQHAFFYVGGLEIEAQAAFEKALAEHRLDWARLIAYTLRCLPHEEKQEAITDFLVKAMEVDSQDCAEWLVHQFGVDPEIPLPLDVFEKRIDLYRLTAYENAIFLGHTKFEKYLEGIGCNLSNSSALCWVIDCLINVDKVDRWKRRVVQFGLELLKREPNLDQILDVTVFSEAPRRQRPDPYRYDIFPRNSGKSCREVIEMFAYLNPYFAELHRAI